MSLELSCDSLYFPAEPRDNVVSLRWNAREAHLEPNTSVIFKIKCTAPHLFHVVPRYGALLLADATGAPAQSSSQTAEVTFGLREHHTGADDDGSAAPSAANRASTVRTSRASSATPGGPAYQERFAIEYVVIKSEPLAFQQIFSSLADHAKLTEVVKSMWSLIASGAIPRAHLGTQSSVNMKVYLENVVLNASDPLPQGGDEAAKVVVPSEARLVAPSVHDKASAVTPRNPSSATATNRTSDNGSAAGSSVAPSRRKATDELRALKEEINTMRRDSGASPLGGSPQNIASPSSGGAPSSVPRSANTVATKAASAAAAAATSVSPPVSTEDLIMTFDSGDGAAAGGSGAKTKRKGLKVWMVLAIMFAVYIFVLMMRGSTRHSLEAVSPQADNTSNPLAVQISSRELEQRKG